ncbi:MAG TPA: alkaline phosphatase family protein [Dehalococcoidia bacterium]|nr:alkaline phosphatase family protein [Dehalococcoidia bacterium]
MASAAHVSARSAAAPVGPEQPGGQGLDPNQFASGDRAIIAALTDPAIADQVEFVITYRAPAYEVWSKRGMVHFCRFYAAGGGYRYDVIEQIGENPIARQEHDALITLEEEFAAAERSGSPAGDGAQAFIAGTELSYPFAYERISQLFDSPDAPDLVIHPTAFAAGRQPGQHGNLDVLQSRCPLILSGPGVRRGVFSEAVKQVDIAPTIAHLLRLPLVDGRDITGRTASARGVPPDVYLARQDGRVLDEALDRQAAAPRRAYIFLLDGLHNGELLARLARDDGSLPNLRRLIGRGALYRAGAVSNYPSITWPGHNALGTGAWCGHHGFVNPTFYRRARREIADPQGRQFETERELSHEVDTLYEAVHIRHGQWTGRPGGRGALTAAINEPCNRGAMHASLERRLLGDRERLKALTNELLADVSPRWLEDGQEAVRREAVIDTRGTAQAVLLFSDPEIPPPTFAFHELVLTDGAGHDYGPHSDGARAALDESDRRIGRVLAALDARGLFEETLFIVTSDHGMTAQNLDVSGHQEAWLVEHGVHGIACLRFLYQRDLDVSFEVDGDQLSVTVRDNDADESGERPPLAGAEVVVSRAGGGSEALITGAAGRVTLRGHEAEELHILAEGFNERRFRPDGTEILPDLRAVLYGGRATHE